MKKEERKQIREVLLKRHKMLKECEKETISQLRGTKHEGRISHALSKLRGRRFEVERLRRHLLYDTFPESYIHDKPNND